MNYCEVAIIYEKREIIHHIRKKIKTKTKMMRELYYIKIQSKREREREIPAQANAALLRKTRV